MTPSGSGGRRAHLDWPAAAGWDSERRLVRVKQRCVRAAAVWCGGSLSAQDIGAARLREFGPCNADGCVEDGATSSDRPLQLVCLGPEQPRRHAVCWGCTALVHCRSLVKPFSTMMLTRRPASMFLTQHNAVVIVACTATVPSPTASSGWFQPNKLPDEGHDLAAREAAQRTRRHRNLIKRNHSVSEWL